MPITIYPGTVKKRNLNGTYSDLVPGADANPQLANDIAEEYDPVAGVYSVGDYCIYQSVLYKCITAISTPEAFDSTKWTDVSVAEELTSQKNTLNQLETNVGKILPVITGTTNNSGYTIYPGDYFEANGTLYRLSTSSPAIATGAVWSGTAQSAPAINLMRSIVNTAAVKDVLLLDTTTGAGDKTISDSYTNYKYIMLVAFGDSSTIFPAIIPSHMLITAGYRLSAAVVNNSILGYAAVRFVDSTTVNILSNPNNLRIYGLNENV